MCRQCEGQVTSAVHERFKAMGAADADALERLFEPGLVYAHATGVREPGTAVLEKIRSGAARYTGITVEIDDVRVVDRTAVVLGRFRATLTTPQGSRGIGSQFADVWVETSTGWRLLAYHAAPIAQ